MAISDKAATLLALHTDPELLVVVNVWDAVSAKVVADLPGCKALATASHSIAASAGFPDGEVIPLEEMITAIGRIAAATTLPVSADLEAGYGDAGEAVRRAYLDAGAACVFVPGKLDRRAVEQLVEALGAQKLSVIAVPGSLPLPELAELGVARVSFGPFTQRLALTALADAGALMLDGGSLPDGIRALN